MGAFSKDKEYGRGLTTVFDYGDEMILWDATVDAEKVPTDIGPATKTRLMVSRKDSPGEKFEVTTLASAIASKMGELEDGELPAVVQLLEVPSNYGNDATVLQWIAAFNGTA